VVLAFYPLTTDGLHLSGARDPSIGSCHKALLGRIRGGLFVTEGFDGVEA